MIAIIDYGLGNLLSVAKAFEEVGAGKPVVVTRTPEELEKASHVVLPGVGNYHIGMQNLRRMGFLESLNEQVIGNGKMFLGICLGMQMLSETGEESGQTEGLGWIPGRCRRIRAGDLKLPHIGWNDLEFQGDHPLFQNIAREREFYFVHSYCFDCPPEYTIAHCTYGERFTAAVQRNNVLGTQFHPEKSRETGLKLLRNFLRMPC
jgi:imidazole glycerol-phosphate synthase subunit HisH